MSASTTTKRSEASFPLVFAPRNLSESDRLSLVPSPAKHLKAFKAPHLLHPNLGIPSPIEMAILDNWDWIIRSCSCTDPSQSKCRVRDLWTRQWNPTSRLGDWLGWVRKSPICRKDGPLTPTSRCLAPLQELFPGDLDDLVTASPNYAFNREDTFTVIDGPTHAVVGITPGK